MLWECAFGSHSANEASVIGPLSILNEAFLFGAATFYIGRNTTGSGRRSIRPRRILLLTVLATLSVASFAFSSGTDDNELCTGMSIFTAFIICVFLTLVCKISHKNRHESEAPDGELYRLLLLAICVLSTFVVGTLSRPCSTRLDAHQTHVSKVVINSTLFVCCIDIWRGDGDDDDDDDCDDETEDFL